VVATTFTFNNKVHITTKSSLFKVNYRREPRISFDISKKEKHVKAEEFVKEMKEMYEKTKAVLIKSQEKMKKYTDRNRKKAKEYKVGDRVLISTKDSSVELMKRVTKKLMEKYIGPYKIKKIVSENTVKLELLVSLRIYPVVNMSRIVLYKEQIKEQKKIPPPSVEIEGENEYKV